MTLALGARSRIFRPGRFWVVHLLRVVIQIVLTHLCKYRIQVELIPLARMVLGPFRRLGRRALVTARGLAIHSV